VAKVERSSAAGAQAKKHIQLIRGGTRKQFGPAGFYFKTTGKFYSRKRVYHMEVKHADELLATGYFERVLPEDVERARIEAARPRGTALGKQRRRRSSEYPEVGRPSRGRVGLLEADALPEVAPASAPAVEDEPSVSV
jgi:hypothetical protein